MGLAKNDKNVRYTFKMSLTTYLLIFGAVAIALLANSVSAIWAAGDSKFSLWLVAVLLISPLVFISFGLLTTKLGVSITSGTIDSLLTVSTVLVGLIAFGEWHKISIWQGFGLVLVLTGMYMLLSMTKAA